MFPMALEHGLKDLPHSTEWIDMHYQCIREWYGFPLKMVELKADSKTSLDGCLLKHMDKTKSFSIKYKIF